jgi:hypothetical protein
LETLLPTNEPFPVKSHILDMTIDLIQSLFLKEFANIRILSRNFNSGFKIFEKRFLGGKQLPTDVSQSIFNAPKGTV